MNCWGEDWEMWVRMANQYPVWYEAKPLAVYRQSTASLTGKSVRTGQNIQDFRQAIEIVNEYLPQNKAAALRQAALKNYANYALATADKFVESKDLLAAISQIREAFRCHFSLKNTLFLLKLSLKAIKQKMDVHSVHAGYLSKV